jgi:hypothetical protein
LARPTGVGQNGGTAMRLAKTAEPGSADGL